MEILEELRTKAKELGVKNAHLYKDLGKLQILIESKEDELKLLEKREAKVAEDAKKNEGKAPFEYEVIAGKFFMQGVCYRVGDKFKSHKDLTVHTSLRKV